MNSPSEEPVTAVLIVDHGSRRAESNRQLHDAAKRFVQQSGYAIVEPAHMELAEPSIRQAFDRCVERGANRIIVFPWFLAPGRHWTEDIPHLVQEAAKAHPQIFWIMTPPFGLHPGMFDVVNDRIRVTLLSQTFQSASDSVPPADPQA